MFTPEKVTELYDSGVNCLRFNFSHANHEDAARLMKQVKELNASGRTNLSLALDTKGPEIRVGDLAEKIQYHIGDKFRIFVDPAKMTEPTDIYADYQYLVEDVEVGQEIKIDSGLLSVTVLEKTADYLLVESHDDRLIKSRRHVNLPGVKLRLPAMIDKDKEDLIFACEQKVDFVFASFIRSKEHLQEIRAWLDQHGGKDIQLVSKVENQEAMENMEEIVQYSDGVIIARGDLAVEVPFEQVPYYQKHIMDLCFKYGKFVVVATEMLKSMMEAQFPTRAEISDVYNSVIMRADCGWLSDETALGKHPALCAATMSKIFQEAEKHTNNKHKDFNADFYGQSISDEVKAITRHALNIADEVQAKSVIALTKDGLLARIIAAFRPNQPTYIFTNEDVVTKLNPYFGLETRKFDKWDLNPGRRSAAIEILKAE